jgi:hypothetical protein
MSQVSSSKFSVVSSSSDLWRRGCDDDEAVFAAELVPGFEALQISNCFDFDNILSDIRNYPSLG